MRGKHHWGKHKGWHHHGWQPHSQWHGGRHRIHGPARHVGPKVFIVPFVLLVLFSLGGGFGWIIWPVGFFLMWCVFGGMKGMACRSDDQGYQPPPIEADDARKHKTNPDKRKNDASTGRYIRTADGEWLEVVERD